MIGHQSVSVPLGARHFAVRARFPQCQVAWIVAHLTGFPYSPVRRGSRGGAAHRKRSATQRAGKGIRPAVALSGPPGALQTLPDAPHRAAACACPAGR